MDDPLEPVRLASLGSAIAKEDFDLLGPRLIASWMEIPAAGDRANGVPVAVDAGSADQAAEPNDLERARAA